MVVYRASKTFNAPIKYVYEWATDYTEGDNQIWGGKHRRVILLKSKSKVVYASYKDGTDGKPKLAVRVVTLDPSKYSWHLDYYAEEDTETGDYKLTSLGKNKTRLNMIFRNKWKNGKGPSAEDFEKETNLVWEKYAEALENDYNSDKKENYVLPL
ncbi:MAG: hypothetical protein PXY39_04720 [archaeon]|nr:hypothetical protein [archaeon]